MTAGTGTHRGYTTVAVVLCLFMAALEMTVVSTAMPSVVADLGGLSRYAWVFTAYMLTSTVTVPIYGKLADLYGRKPVLQVGLLLFLLGSVASGAARSLEQLILFRALQGLGAGAMQPMALTIAGDLYTLEQRARVQGWFGSVWAFSALVGPLLGGLIVQVASWRWVFLLNVPLGIASWALLRWAFQEQVERRKHVLDVLGAALLTGGVLAMLFAAQGGRAAGLEAAVAAALLLAFVLVEQRAKEPVLPLSLFRQRAITISSAAGALFSAAMFGATTYVPLFVQGVLGGTPTQAGRMITPMLLSWPVCSTLAGRILPRLGFRPLVVGGLLLAAVANLGLAVGLRTGAPLWIPLGAMAVFGAGLGLASTAMLLAVQHSVGWEMRGVATASNLFFRTIGGTIGVGVVGGVLAAAIQADPTIPASAGSELLRPGPSRTVPPEVLAHLSAALEGALRVGFWIMFGCAAAAFVAGLLYPRTEKHLQAQ